MTADELISEFKNALTEMNVLGVEFGLNFNDEMNDWNCKTCSGYSDFGEGADAVRHEAACPVPALRRAYRLALSATETA